MKYEKPIAEIIKIDLDENLMDGEGHLDASTGSGEIGGDNWN